MARTIALYNFAPWVIVLMCVLAVILVVSFGIKTSVTLRSSYVTARTLIHNDDFFRFRLQS